MASPPVFVITNDDFHAICRHVEFDLAKRMVEAFQGAARHPTFDESARDTNSVGSDEEWPDRAAPKSLFLAMQTRHMFVRRVCNIANVSELKVLAPLCC